MSRLIITIFIVLFFSCEGKNNIEPVEFIEYYRDGVIKSKGLFYKDSLKKGRWTYYDSKGFVKSIEDYKIVKNNSILNQQWMFNQKGDTIYEKSKFYDLILNKDTLEVNELLKAVIYMPASLFKNRESEILVYLPIRDEENFNKDFSNEKNVRLDTFHNLSKDVVENQKLLEGFNPKHVVIFGKYYLTPGKKVVRGIIVEYYFQNDESSEGGQMRKENKTYFEKEIFVKDSLKGNVPN
ncbi:hypothetical protein AAON49_05800 [Pseudotenacibaculum sp. MALMAid0570]|uniref:hypothetical protein n=1 Tax=Pseudotenacibaculum sp. MALMAid0570 TaxID=3143938 RepID=UPI0032DE6273